MNISINETKSGINNAFQSETGVPCRNLPSAI